MFRGIHPSNLFLLDKGNFKVIKKPDDDDDIQDYLSENTVIPESLNPQLDPSADIYSLGHLLLFMCLREQPKIKELRAGIFPNISAYYNAQLKELIFEMLSVQPHKIPTAEAILNSKFIKRFLFEESLKKHEWAIDEALGQPFELYAE